MREPYGEGPASQTGPESCVRDGNASCEALTGEDAGQPSHGLALKPSFPGAPSRRSPVSFYRPVRPLGRTRKACRFLWNTAAVTARSLCQMTCDQCLPESTAAGFARRRCLGSRPRALLLLTGGDWPGDRRACPAAAVACGQRSVKVMSSSDGCACGWRNPSPSLCCGSVGQCRTRGAGRCSWPALCGPRRGACQSAEARGGQPSAASAGEGRGLRGPRVTTPTVPAG